LGYKISRITVAEYIRELGLRSKLSKNFTVASPSKVWVSDITYIQTNKGFLYLTRFIDLYDRKIVGWSLNNGMSTEETSLAT